MEDKYLCVMALFDDETNNKLIEIRKILKENDLSYDMYPPHITLGAYVNISENDLIKYTENFCLNNNKVNIKLDKLGKFSNKVIYLTTSNDKNIKDLHFKFHQKYDEFHGNVGYNYSIESNKFTPHMTLLKDCNPLKINRADKIMQSLNINIEAQITKIGIYEFFPMRKIKIFNLK